MNEIWVLIILAVVIIFGGYWLEYRSGKHKALRKNEDDDLSPGK